jgi:hypothetical protein
MTRKALLIIGCISLLNTALAQPHCAIRMLSKSTKQKLDIYLQNRESIINLKLKFDNQFKEEPVFKKLAMTNFKQTRNIDNSLSQSVDSILIKLDNDLSWNLEFGPPQKPKGFVIRMFIAKGRKDQEVRDRIHFLEFCSQFDDSNKTYCNVRDTYKVYTTIKYENEAILHATYFIDFSSKKTELLTLKKAL